MTRSPSIRIGTLGMALALSAATGLALAGPEGHAAKSHHAADHTPLEQLVPFEQPELWIGSDAPDLRIAKFFKGESVHEFEEDRVYVVEFWATWCGPCIRAFPHLTEMQEEHADDVTFVGVNIWERGNESQSARIERVGEFVEGQGERMGYTVAIEEEGKMAETWMKRAGRNGIPSAFIVDGKGKVAWMGHPMGMDEPLERIVKGEHDYKADAASLRKEAHTEQAYSAFIEGVHAVDEDEAAKAYKIGDAMAAELIADNAQMLNAIAWPILDDRSIIHRDNEFAYRIAERACEASDWKDSMILDTYALAAFKLGKVDRAIEIQQKALDLLENEDFRAELESRLKKYKSEKDDG